jgi:hypothetical protein
MWGQQSSAGWGSAPAASGSGFGFVGAPAASSSSAGSSMFGGSPNTGPTSLFGQPAAPGFTFPSQTPAVVQVASFGSPAQSSPRPFGQATGGWGGAPAATASGLGFGGAGVFGGPNTAPTSLFGQLQPAAPGFTFPSQTPAVVQVASFGSPAQSSPRPFGQATGGWGGAPAATASSPALGLFGAPSSAPRPFGQAFGAAALGGTTPATSAGLFGAPSSAPQPFGQAFGAAASGGTTFGTPPAASGGALPSLEFLLARDPVSNLYVTCLALRLAAAAFRARVYVGACRLTPCACSVSVSCRALILETAALDA